MRILKDGELGTFWLENPKTSTVAPTIDTRSRHRRHAPPWIYLCTARHTGTHFLRVLLELHPKISFWKCDRTQVDGRPLAEWHQLHREAQISYRELLALGVRTPADLPEWTKQEAAKLRITIPPKQIESHLIHSHADRTTYWYPSLPTVVSIRDPLLAIISGLRRGGTDAAENILGGFRFLASGQDDCFFFCVDQWQSHRERALELLAYLDLEPTQEIYDYLACWPSPNAAEAHEQLILDKSPELAEARRLSLQEGQVHPMVEPWAERLRAAGLQRFCESLGYRNLAWFESRTSAFPG